MGEKKYKEIESTDYCVADAVASYGDINAMKVQLVNRIMRMDEPKDLLSVLDFVKNRTEPNEETKVAMREARSNKNLKEVDMSSFESFLKSCSE